MNKIIELKKMKDMDIDLFKGWLMLPHVAKWYHDPLDWIYEVEHREDEYEWINHFIVITDAKPIGFCQYYEYYHSEETWHGNIEIEGTYSIDYLIGDLDYLKKGYGKLIVKELVKAIKKNHNAKRIIVQPESENQNSCMTLMSSGFIYDNVNEIYIMIL